MEKLKAIMKERRINVSTNRIYRPSRWRPIHEVHAEWRCSNKYKSSNQQKLDRQRGTEAGSEASINRTKLAYLGNVREAIRKESRDDLAKARRLIRDHNMGKPREERITAGAISRVISDERKKQREYRR